jgi:hypothetical protein
MWFTLWDTASILCSLGSIQCDLHCGTQHQSFEALGLFNLIYTVGHSINPLKPWVYSMWFTLWDTASILCSLGSIQCDLHCGTQHQSFVALGLFNLIYTVGHSINPLKPWVYSYDITVKDVLFTITSSVTNQTGGCGACSLLQSTWSINENTRIFAGIVMTRKHCIGVIWLPMDCFFQWDSAIKIQLRMLVWYRTDIVISSKSITWNQYDIAVKFLA